MEAYLQITFLNDFVFCPYSVYLHQVFDNNVQELYSAAPQQRGKAAHSDIDSFEQPDLPNMLSGIYVISNKFRVYGKIDKYYVKEKKLVESKYEIKTLYRGYYYQIWTQYFAMIEMGFKVEQLFFYEIKTRKYMQISIPGKSETDELINHIRKIARFDFESPIKVNPAKCKHCIYTSLCDKTQIDHVYA